MTVNEFLEVWAPVVSYIDADALKVRFSALRGLSNVRPNLTTEQLVQLANNVLVTNQAQYEALAQVNPFKTYFDTSSGGYKDTNSGTDKTTVTDTRVQHDEFNPGTVDTDKMEYGRVDDNTFTPTGIKQNDEFAYAYNATTANQPDRRLQESYLNNYNEKNNNKASGTDTRTLSHTGVDTTTRQILDGDLQTSLEYGKELENKHNEEKSGYVLRDIVELIPEWTNIYDTIVQDIFRVIGVLVATRKIDFSLGW